MDTTTESPPPVPKIADGEKLHTLHLLNGSIMLARHLLTAGGWATKPVHIRRGKRLRAALPKFEAPKDASEEWDNTEHAPVDLPEALRKVGADCLKHCLEKGALGATDSIERLLVEFGVVGEE